MESERTTQPGRDAGETGDQALNPTPDNAQRDIVLDSLKQSEERLTEFLGSVQEGVWVIDRDARTTYVNPRMAEILGMTVYEMLWKPLFYFLDSKGVEAAKSNLARWEKGASEETELSLIRKNGKRVNTVIKVTPLKDESQNYAGAIISVRDLSEERKEAEALRIDLEKEKRARAELEGLLKKKSEFNRALVHELKTPLTPIIASSDLLMGGLHDEPWLGLAKSINRGTMNLSSRIDELLDVSRDELGILKVNPRPTDLLPLIKETAEGIRPLIESRKETLAVELPDTLPLIPADDARIRQVLLNLLSNASKFSPEGSTITLRARQEGNNIILQVQDTGIGISEEDQKHLFELYYRGHANGTERSGLGIGLALCKRFVELHHGTIRGESQLGKGSTFTVTLPVS